MPKLKRHQGESRRSCAPLPPTNRPVFSGQNRTPRLHVECSVGALAQNNPPTEVSGIGGHSTRKDPECAVFQAFMQNSVDPMHGAGP